MKFRYFLLFFLLFVAAKTYSQQDVDFHLTAHLFPGQNIIKVKRDFNDVYLWVLGQNNKVYRVNSLTMAVDDYTQTFAPYNNVNFIDIAGRSMDTVYVAANATEVIEYEKGILRVIDENSGISGTVTSIGLDYRSPRMYYINLPNILDIGTTTSFYNYDYQKESISSQTNRAGKNQVFEATYRTLATAEVGNVYYDMTQQLAVYDLTPITAFGGAIQYNTPAFGYTVNTFYYLTNGFSPWSDDYDDDDYLAQVWGTEKGLFQNEWGDSYFLWDPTIHYLDGIKVNKVTSIFGLLAFGSRSQFPTAGLLRENLLIGTKQGLYFTNNDFGNYVQAYLRNLNTFTLDTDIGNKPINDICVDATTYAPTLCEDAVWVAASDGLYFLKPDYGAYFNPQALQAISFKNEPDTLSKLNLCSGDTARADINSSVYSGNSIQWYKNGTALTGKTTNTIAITTPGNYYALLYDPCSGLHVTTNLLTVNIITSPVFTFNYPALTQQCNTNPDTLQTTYSPSYHYRWYTNEVLNGDTTNTFVVTQTGKYKVEVSACTNSWVPSKEVEYDLISLPTPAITPAQTSYCAEDTATLAENVKPAAGYKINWYRNGTLLPADTNLTSIKTLVPGSYTVTVNSTIAPCLQTSAAYNLAFVQPPVFTFNYPPKLQYCAGSTVTLQVSASNNSYQYQWYNNGLLLTNNTSTLLVTQPGDYYAEVSSCPGSWIKTQQVQVIFVKLPLPSINTDKIAYCIGDLATVSLDQATYPTYQVNWYRNGVALPQYTNQNSFTTNVGGNYTVTIVNNNVQTDGTTCSQTSAIRPVIFDLPPAVSIQAVENTPVCSGQTVNLAAIHDPGTVLWSTGETTDQIAVTTSGTYKVTVMSAAGCTSDTSVTVTFLPSPHVAVKDTFLCLYKKQTITLAAPAGFVDYIWNGLGGKQTFDVSQPQTVTLTVVSENGCTATQNIQVSDVCAVVFIPNTFTPNNDGVNDTWQIEGLGDDQTASVKVFSRYGAQVYDSKGYGTPWNGECKGQKLPAGVYYYVITAKNDSEKFNGWLTILY